MSAQYVAIPIDDLPRPAQCNCEFTPYDGEDEDGEESWHYLRRCQACRKTWWSLHCPHDGNQSTCECGLRLQMWPNSR